MVNIILRQDKAETFVLTSDSRWQKSAVIYLVALLVFVLSALVSSPVLAKTPLNFGLMVINGEQRNAYMAQVAAFERVHPDIKVNVQALESEDYKREIESWLQAGAHSDVLFWFGGERLNWYIEKDWVAPLDALWHKHGLYEAFSKSSQSAASRNGLMYGVPIHYYHWGIYYRKSLFKRLGLAVPENWQQFLEVCEALKAAKITPIALGSQEYWPLGGWFDYLNLRENGLEFHLRLVQGDVPYHDVRVRNVFERWKILLEADYFLPDHANLNWRDSLPYLYRNLAGMMLMGNFWTSQIPPELKSDFSVFSFPNIHPEIPHFEEAPTDVLIMPKNVVNREAAEKFLAFMAKPDVQGRLNASLGMLSPRIDSPKADDHFLDRGRAILKSAQGASQFYDRDNPQPIAIDGMKEMSRFVANTDLMTDVLLQLELLKTRSFAD